MNDAIKVGIIEDDSEIRQLLQLLINGSPGFSCLQTFVDCESAMAPLLANPPDLLLMDVDLPGISGIEGVKQLKEKLPDLDIVMLTVHEDQETIFQALCAGAVGYLVKGLPPVKLLQCIQEAYEGGSPMSTSIARKVIGHFHPQQNNPLSKREIEVLKMLCDGENYKTIAQLLFISTNTVKAHIKNIYTKLHVNNRAEAVSEAIKKRLV